MLSDLKSRFRVVGVTSRQAVLTDVTRDWIEFHFPNTFDDILLGNHFDRDGGESRSKREMCESIGARILIDDSPTHALDCAAGGMTTVLFGMYDWNRVAPEGRARELALAENVYRVGGWPQLQGLLQRVGRDGRVRPLDCLTVSERRDMSFYTASSRRTLRQQPTLSLTATGGAIPLLTNLVADLRRAGDVTMLEAVTGLDAAAPGASRMPRATFRVERTPALMDRFVEIEEQEQRLQTEAIAKKRQGFRGGRPEEDAEDPIEEEDDPVETTT